MSRFVGSYNFTPSAHDLESCSSVKYDIYKRLPTRGNWSLIYGFDHAVGYFIQFESNDEADIIDIDYLFDKLSGKETAIILNAFCESSDTLKIHIDDAMEDIPFS